MRDPGLNPALLLNGSRQIGCSHQKFVFTEVVVDRARPVISGGKVGFLRPPLAVQIGRGASHDEIRGSRRIFRTKSPGQAGERVRGCPLKTSASATVNKSDGLKGITVGRGSDAVHILSNFLSRTKAWINLAVCQRLRKQFPMPLVLFALQMSFVGNHSQRLHFRKLPGPRGGYHTRPVDVLKTHHPGDTPETGDPMRDPGGSEIANVKVPRRRRGESNAHEIEITLYERVLSRMSTSTVSPTRFPNTASPIGDWGVMTCTGWPSTRVTRPPPCGAMK